MHLRGARIVFVLALIGVVYAPAQTSSSAQANTTSGAAAATQWPTVDGTVVLPDFRFGTGETLPQLRLHYLTLGTPHRDASGHTDNAVLLLHGTGGNAHSLMNPLFSNVLFGPGAPLDITKYFLILPDDIGHGQSSKPSDGLHAHFPAYDYDDMVRSQRMMLDEMKIDHLRLILGTSMGCMQAFVWGETYPGFADALAPFACLPVPIAGRNRMMRYMAIEAIRNDPAWMGGEYKTEPSQGLHNADELIFIMGSSPLQLQKLAPTRELAEKYLDGHLALMDARTDANDMIFYVNASRNYDPSAHLDRITVPVLWINSADDFINPPELGIAEKMVNLMPHARFILLPISDATRGHGTHTVAAVWKDYLAEFMRASEPTP
ncbi:MAG TPA: alpha/beta fold hydrolase [Terracidiphilus sp.]|jgi:homoserine O-acetyltransferase/O-succinyltransferase|nr:alpha/beta fold hydrolase [Terracidiphilus sp.]